MSLTKHAIITNKNNFTDKNAIIFNKNNVTDKTRYDYK